MAGQVQWQIQWQVQWQMQWQMQWHVQKVGGGGGGGADQGVSRSLGTILDESCGESKHVPLVLVQLLPQLLEVPPCCLIHLHHPSDSTRSGLDITQYSISCVHVLRFCVCMTGTFQYLL